MAMGSRGRYRRGNSLLGVALSPCWQAARGDSRKLSGHLAIASAEKGDRGARPDRCGNRCRGRKTQVSAEMASARRGSQPARSDDRRARPRSQTEIDLIGESVEVYGYYGVEARFQL